MKKTILLQFTLLSATLLLNSGCVFGLFDDEPKEVTNTTPRVITPPQTKIMPTTIIEQPTLIAIAPECTDDINSPNSCQKTLVQVQELTQPKIEAQTGGEVHNLKSFQGQNITIIERKTGYVFPELENKVVILEMFGKNCSHCIKEMPIMNKLHRKYKNNLEIVAVQVEGQMSNMEAKSLIRRHHINYPVISGQTATNLQYNIQSTYGWTGILPFTMVIKNGVTEFTYRGQVSYNEINKDIRSILR